MYFYPGREHHQKDLEMIHIWSRLEKIEITKPEQNDINFVYSICKIILFEENSCILSQDFIKFVLKYDRQLVHIGWNYDSPLNRWQAITRMNDGSDHHRVAMS